MIEKAQESGLIEPRSGADAKPAPVARGQELTPREREVLQLMADGLSHDDIAARLSTDFSTIFYHVIDIKEKLGTMDSAKMVTMALESGLIESRSGAPWYRGQPVDERPVNLEYASKLREVFTEAIAEPDDVVQRFVEQIAQDLSGVYDEQYLVKYTGRWDDLYRHSYLELRDKLGFIELRGEVIHDGHRIGWVHMTCDQEKQGLGIPVLAVSIWFNDINEELVGQHTELFRTLRAALEPTLSPYFERSGVRHLRYR